MTHEWQGQWIHGEIYFDLLSKLSPAPVFRKVFRLEEVPRTAEIFLCGLGWHELTVNGIRPDDRVLSPAPTQYHKHAPYIVYPVAPLLRKGENVLVILLGNGYYNSLPQDTWGFDRADWRDYPKLACDVVVDGQTVVSSDESWKTISSPILRDGIRTGEVYDARLEIQGMDSPGFDDSCWKNAEQCIPPGGGFFEETMPPCRKMTVIPVRNVRTLADGGRIYDFGVNLTGWCRISVHGNPGDSITLRFSERIRDDGDLDRENIAVLTRSDDFQTDTYILKGNGLETWEPRFTYHGFRYVRADGLIPEKIEAVFIHTSFHPAGSFDSDSAMLNQLQECTVRSFLCNFTGFPTDCPHREKNGWTGDAQLAAATGLWNFDASEAFRHFLRTVTDVQRDDGQLPGFAPNPGGSCYNWGNGPAWDYILFEYPWQIRLFTGCENAVHECYPAMKRYLDYCHRMEIGHLVQFGLGDWCHPAPSRMAPVEVTSSAFYYSMLTRMILFAEWHGVPEEAEIYAGRAEEVRKAFLRKYRNPDGSYASGEWTALAAAVFFGLAPHEECAGTVSLLAEKVRANAYKSDFGIIGAKCVPRVLSEYGYAGEAFRLVTQPEFPGWGYWIQCGATTLRENWDNSSSQNHIMFGDISAWMYEHLAGIAPVTSAPGFKKIRIAPRIVSELNRVCAEHMTPYGKAASSWERTNDMIRFEFTVPEGSEASILLPDGTAETLSGGRRSFQISGI